MKLLKLITFSFLTLTIISTYWNSIYAQNNFIESPNTSLGGILKSDHNKISRLYFYSASDRKLGNIYARFGKPTGSVWGTRLSLRNHLDEDVLTIFNNDVGIGTHTPKATLDVKGFMVVGESIDNLDKDGFDLSDRYSIIAEKGILTEKCKVAVKDQTFWSDYVFEEDYEMMEIEELEDYVTENKHLPNVPSAEEVVENGIDVATMDAKLLEKIEEAYLYIIDINKKVDALATENQSLKTSLQSISTSGK